MRKWLLGTVAIAALATGSVQSMDLLYDGVLEYWHADMEGHAGATAGQSSIDGDSSGVITFGFRLDNGRSLLDVLYSQISSDGSFGMQNADFFTNTSSGGNFQANLTPGAGMDVDIDKLDIHLRHPLYRTRSTTIRGIAGLTTLDLDSTYNLAPIDGDHVGVSSGSTNGVLGVEVERFLKNRTSLRASYRQGFSLSGGETDFSEWQLGAVRAVRNNIEVELGYKSLEVETTLFEDTKRENELKHEFDGPYARMNYLF